MPERMDFHVHEAEAKAPMVSGDAPIPCQRRNEFPRAASWKFVSLRLAGAVVSSTAATARGANRFRCGKPGHTRCKCKEYFFAGVTPGLLTGGEARAAGLLAHGRGAAISRRVPGDVASFVSQESESRPQN